MARKLALSIIFLCTAVAMGYFFSLKPWKLYREQQSRTQSAENERLSAQSKRAELAKANAKIATPLGKEEYARENGYIKPNERRVDFGP